MFLMHFVGDLHQPLHVEDAYRGGNEITPVCFAKACANNNLHSVWDKYIPHKIVTLKNSATNEEEKVAAQEWADKLYTANERRGFTTVKQCDDVLKPVDCSLAWAKESNTWICKYVMKQSVEWLKSNDLSKGYYTSAVPIVEELIGKAGVRLGAWLNAMVASVQAEMQEVDL
jgi:hypothetical protein